MSPPRFLIASFIALSSASLTPEDHLFSALLKRQEPGTPSYDCHDNCGTAITVSKAGGDFCTDEVFLYDYNNCLQCSGPDNFDIWKYYGRSLGKAAETCEGLETEPKSGKQEDVGEAKHPGESSGEVSSSAEAATEASTSVPASSTAEATVSSTAEATISSVVESSTSSASAPASASPSETITGAPVPTVSGAPSPSANGTAPVS